MPDVPRIDVPLSELAQTCISSWTGCSTGRVRSVGCRGLGAASACGSNFTDRTKRSCLYNTYTFCVAAWS